MPQIAVNSSNIGTFFFTVTFDLLNRRVIFNTTGSTWGGSSGSGIFNIQGCSFSLVDSEGVVLTSIDFSDPTKYIQPATDPEFILDLSYLNYAFLFNTYEIQGAIKDQNGDVYYTSPVYAKVCQPIDFNESGYVPGTFQVQANCPDNVLTVKDLTVFVYNKQIPESIVTDGTLYYPTGTISSIPFTGTPFSNNVIYTGQYRINNDSTATYTIGTDIYVEVTYRTAQAFDITCANKIGDLMCCLQSLENEALKNCNNAIGKAASEKMAQITPVFMIGLAKEINGMDASEQAAIIRKTLSCNCGATSVGQNQMTPINPSVTNIVLQGVGGTSIAAPTVVGNTKTYNIQSYVYQVAKGNSGDNAFSISVDTSISNVVKYVITFNYTIQAGYILDAIAASPSLTQQLNDLITGSGNVSLTGLDGKCVIDLSSADYTASVQGLTASSTVTSVVINSTIYLAPALFVTNTVGIKNWLDSLALGTFTVLYSNGVLTVFTTGNTNTVSTITVGSPSSTVQFQSSNATLVQVLQAIIDYLCELTDLQMVLSSALAVCTLDYNNAVVTTTLPAGYSQYQFNSTIATAICNIASRISTLTSVTCARLQSIFIDNAGAAFNGASARVYGLDQNGACVGYTVQQLALGIMQAANSYSDVKAAFCAINCSTPATCPDISGLNTGIVTGNIAFYGLTWASATTAMQTVTLQYKLTSSSTWITYSSSIQILPSGNINGTTPIQIIGLTPGATYNVRAVNNCGGNGATQIVTVPTSSIFTADYQLENTLYLICSASTITLYSNASFGSGVVLYTDPGLTTPITGYMFVSGTSGNIYAIDPSTGTVGADTGSSCNNGDAGTYSIANSTGSICGVATQTLYTNGAFAPGGTLYSDSALTTPVTGFDYVLNAADGFIYALNNATGVIGLSTGLSCSSVLTSVKLSNSYSDVCAQVITNVYTNGTFGSGKILYLDAGLTTPITGYAYVSNGFSAAGIYNLNTVTGLVGSALTQACGDLQIYNGTSWATVTAVTGITGFTLTGTVAPSTTQQGTHIAFGASIQLTVTGSGSGSAILRKNGAIVSTKTLNPGTTIFDYNSFVVGDVIMINLS